MENSDVVVIGAGPAGLCACKTYLQVHPNAKIIVLDQNETLGGTWCQERLYEELRSNNKLGAIEYPDFPMDPETLAVKKNDFVSGDAMHQYLITYALKFGVAPRIRLKSNVEGIRETSTADAQSWIVTVSSGDDKAREYEIQTKKLIVATGLTSRRSVPVYRGHESFQRPILHTKDLASTQHTLKSSERVVVVGGAKSAYDAVYCYARAGVQVDWIIRTSGRGPVWMTQSYATPFKIWVELLVVVRFLTWFMPSTWQDVDGYGWPRWFLHQTPVGRLIVRAFTNILDQDAADFSGMKNHPETKKLIPDFHLFQNGTAFSILNYPVDILDFVRSGQVQIHRAEIDHLSPGAVHLDSGETLYTDLMFCATGWRFVPTFLEGLEQDLSLAHWTDSPDLLVLKADNVILERFPELRQEKHRHWPPVMEPGNDSKVDVTQKYPKPANMYRFIVPPKYFSNRSIAFIGHCLTLRTFTMMHMQSLWAVAFLDGNLKDQDNITQDEALWQATLHAQSTKWTQPFGSSARVPDMVFQSMIYYDQLLADLGLERWRKGGMFREIFSPYMPPDYRTVVEEFLARPGKSKTQ